MLRPIVLVSILISGLSGHGSAPLLAAEGPTAVRKVTKPPRAEEIEFVRFDFQQPTLGHVRVELFRIEEEPSSGARYPFEAVIGGEEAIATASFEVIAEDGTLIQPLMIARRGTGVPGSSQFIGLMNVPSQPFRVVLTGQSVDGRPFRRVYERLFRPVNRPGGRRSVADLPPEHADLQRQLEEQGVKLMAETETDVAAHATVPLVMPRVDVSKVMYAPLVSPAGNPIGVRITYDVEFSLAGEYNPRLRVHPEYLDESTLGFDEMRVLDSSLEPLPRQAHPPHAPAGTGDGASVLAYGAHFLYEARTVYHFAVDLVPSFINPAGRRPKSCLSHQEFRTAKAQTAFAKRLAREGHTTYRVYIGGTAFEGQIEKFSGEGTFYRSFVKEAVQECPPPVM